jgi:hypothetical protein
VCLQPEKSHVLWAVFQRNDRSQNDNIANLNASRRKTCNGSSDDEGSGARSCTTQSGADFKHEYVGQECVLWGAKRIHLADEQLTASTREEERATVPEEATASENCTYRCGLNQSWPCTHQPISFKLWKSFVIAGIAVETMVLS